MNCKEIEKLLQLYHDGELPIEKRREVKSHLAGCPGCTTRLAELSALDALIVDGEAEQVPDPGKHYWQGFAMRVTRRLGSQRPSRLRLRRRTRLFRFNLIPYLSAGAAIVLVLIASLTIMKKIPAEFTEEETLPEATAEREFAPGVTLADETLAEEDASGIVFGPEIEIKKEYEASDEDKGVGRTEEVIISLPRTDEVPDRTNLATGVTGTEDKEAEEAAESISLNERRGAEEDDVKDGRLTGENRDKVGLFGGATKSAEKAVSEGEIRFQTPMAAQTPQPGTLRVVVDSAGKLVDVIVYRSSGDLEADSTAIEVYKNQWEGQIFRQRRASLLVPFEQKVSN